MHSFTFDFVVGFAECGTPSHRFVIDIGVAALPNRYGKRIVDEIDRTVVGVTPKLSTKCA